MEELPDQVHRRPLALARPRLGPLRAPPRRLCDRPEPEHPPHHPAAALRLAVAPLLGPVHVLRSPQIAPLVHPHGPHAALHPRRPRSRLHLRRAAVLPQRLRRRQARRAVLRHPQQRDDLPRPPTAVLRDLQAPRGRGHLDPLHEHRPPRRRLLGPLARVQGDVRRHRRGHVLARHPAGWCRHPRGACPEPACAPPGAAQAAGGGDAARDGRDRDCGCGRGEGGRARRGEGVSRAGRGARQGTEGEGCGDGGGVASWKLRRSSEERRQRRARRYLWRVSMRRQVSRLDPQRTGHETSTHSRD